MCVNRLIRAVKLARYKHRGLVVGDNFHIENRVHIDSGFVWLVEIGNDVTLAPGVCILAHDASAKKQMGHSSIKRVTLGNNVFVGANSIILPGVTIGDNVIIGAQSVVAKDIPANSVACGSPAAVIKSIDVFTKDKLKQYEIGPKITSEMIKEARKNSDVRKKLLAYIGNSRAFIDEGQNE